MKSINRFLNEEDYKLINFQCLDKELEDIYANKLKGRSGTSIPQIKTKLHWSRAWEYPWAIINSEVKVGERVLDCGCAGSPLLPFLAQFGCEAYGIDPNILEFENSLLKYYWKLIKQGLKEIKNLSFRKTFMILRQPTVSGRYYKNPNELMNLNINFYAESLDKMHFEDNFFDKIFCISVIEHLDKDVVYQGMKEMLRVLKKNGLLVITMDINEKTRAFYKNLIKNFNLYGKSDFRESTPFGPVNVIGLIFKKVIK